VRSPAAAPPRADPLGLLPVAQSYVDAAAARGELPPVRVADLAAAGLRLDAGYCRRVAGVYDRAPARESHPELSDGYARLKRETVRQYDLLRSAGIRVEPWLADGQPYRGARDLVAKLTATRVLHVYLTRDGHGPGRAAADHPMCEPSGVRVRGIDLLYNDLFRAVHDVFGHAMLQVGMGVEGELRAAYVHMAMYTPPAHPVLFTEHVSQICWFFYGPHLADATGRLPERGEPGWVPPDRRPYPPQKVFRCPSELIDQFKAGFREAPR
jgi:hypothetical protein